MQQTSTNAVLLLRFQRRDNLFAVADLKRHQAAGAADLKYGALRIGQAPVVVLVF